MTEERRNQSLEKFLNGQTKILVTTQVLGRGVPFPNVNVVILFDIPMRDVRSNSVDRSNFLSQLSRAAKIDAKGYCVSLIGDDSPDLDLDAVIQKYAITSAKIIFPY